MDENLPDRIGAYRIQRVLAEGGMGRVYLAKRISEGGFEMLCVVKTIRPDFSRNEKHVRMFYREARIAATLRHQNIVQVLDFDKVDDTLYLAMEYVEGHDLREVLNEARLRQEPVPLPVALRITIEVLKGLEHAHRRTDPGGRKLGIVHRDLTPNNILISCEGEIKIADFGIAKTALGETDSRNTELKGKLHYLSPEQIEGEAVDARADLFALGIVLYEMITGEKPFQAESVSGSLARIVRCDDLPASEKTVIPREVDALVRGALRRDPAERFESAEVMRGEVEKLLSRLSPDESVSVRDDYRKRFGDRGRGVLGLVESICPHEGTTRTSVSHGDGREGERLRESRAEKQDRGKARRLLLPAIFAALPVVGFVIWIVIQGWTDPEPGELIRHDTFPIPMHEKIRGELPSELLESPLPPDDTVDAAPPEGSVQESHADTVVSQGAQRNRDTVLSDAALPKRTVAGTSSAPEPRKEEPVNPVRAVSEVPGILIVGELNPWAKVYVNGEYMDETPTRRIRLEAGRHTIRLYNPHTHRDAVLTVRIEPGGTSPIVEWPE